MRKLLFAAAVVMLLAGCTGKGYTVEGNIQGLTGTVKLMNGRETVSETNSQEGKFSFKGKLEIPAVYTLTADPGRLALLFLEDGAKLKVTGFIDGEDTRITVTGSVAQDNFRKYQEWEKALYDRYDAAGAEEREAIEEEKEKYTLATIDGNIDNLLGLYLLRTTGHGMEPEDMAARLDRIPVAYRNMDTYTYLAGNAESKLKANVGKHYIDIELPDAGGNNVKLSSVAGPGKYVLLDFWASWCPPCMAEIPHLVKAYEKYHDKGFEIYGVSLDSDRDKWINCIRDKKMDWYHVSALQGWQCPAAKEYGVNSIPASYLIGPDGTIVAKKLTGKKLETILNELLGE